MCFSRSSQFSSLPIASLALGSMLGDLEQIVMLATLRLDGDGYGVTIQDAVRRTARRELTMGTIHKTLVRLEAKGMIASRMGDPTPVRGGRAKRFYKVTPAGLKALRASLSAIRRLADGLEVGLEPG